MSIKGIITDIQRFSLYDGPGIRTAVFFKGCNMSCRWCHNPETISPKPELMRYDEKCIGCLRCVRVCPSGACVEENGGLKFDRTKCTRCFKCAEVCYPQAFAAAGEEMGVGEIMSEILQDEAYYAASGGGVTFTGGEALCQKDFLEALIVECKRHGIHTALETNLNFPFETIERIIESLDLLMFDIKLVDDKRHIAFTNASNINVLSNIEKINALCIPVIVRTPVIPGFNDNPEDLTAAAKKAGRLKNLLYYEILNYNPLGHDKYNRLGKENTGADKRPLTAERLEQLTEALRREGINVRRM